MWTAGESSGAIAGAIGHTRSAVMGQVWRLQRAGQLAKKSTLPPAIPPPVVLMPPPPRPPEHWAEAIKREAIRGPRRYPKKPKVRQRHRPAHPVTLLELTSLTCRFPLGDPREPGFCYCGARPRHPGASYCAHHHALTVAQPVPRVRRR